MGIINAELAVAIGIPVLGGLFVSQLTQESLVGWYKTLRKPFWNPPAVIFAPVWTILYSLLGVASYQVWTTGGFAANKWPLQLYFAQLGLNFLWPLVFFNMRNLFLSVIVNLALLVTSVATQGAFYRVHPEAGQLLLPYVAWLVFANLLNIAVWRSNPHGGDVTATDAPNTVTTKTVEVPAKPGDENYGPTGPATACLAPRPAMPHRLSAPHLAVTRRPAMPRPLRTRPQAAPRSTRFRGAGAVAMAPTAARVLC